MKDRFDFVTLDFFDRCICTHSDACAGIESSDRKTIALSNETSYVPVTRKVTLTDEKNSKVGCKVEHSNIH